MIRLCFKITEDFYDIACLVDAFTYVALGYLAIRQSRFAKPHFANALTTTSPLTLAR